MVGFAGVDGTYSSRVHVDLEHHGHGIGCRLLRLGIGLTGPEAHTITLAGNARAIRLYESEGFRVERTFDDENARYPCTCARLELHPIPGAILPRLGGIRDLRR